ncbi:AMP-binding protein [Cytophaga aurantiaca]|uniref:AMP-binding protein n=1 Tax=Cytophaga aurantiaca TaxID=29530 RepID=UPI000369D712|nr:AMP-binding protein [Cytophaga aurantiaca]
MQIEELLNKSLNGDLTKKVFLEIIGKQYSYGTFFTDVVKINNLFHSKGLVEGDKMFISLKDEYDITLFFMAGLVSGVTVISVDPEINAFRAQKIVEQAAPEMCVLEEYLFEKWNINKEQQFCLSKKETQKKGSLFKKLLKNSASTDPTEDGDSYPAIMDSLSASMMTYKQPAPETIAYILFTSGTTSDPKGVMISQKNLWEHINTLTKVYGMNHQSRILNNLSLYHADGIIQGPVLAACCNATLVRPLKKFEIGLTGEFLTGIYKYRISHLVVVPAIISILYKFSENYEDSFESPDFKFVISVSAHIEEYLWTNFEKTFKTEIVNVYGLTETVAGSLFSGPDKTIKKIGTVGKPVDCLIKIVDQHNQEVPQGEEGELMIKGDHVFKGYYKNESATQLVLNNDWLSSGDLAIIDSEGFVKITGRKKNIVVVGGFNIHPEEISEVINTHPEIMESICIGVKDEVFGEKIIACIVAKDKSKMNKNILAAYLSEHLEHNKMPADILIYDELPKGLSGKVQIKEIEQSIYNNDAESPDAKFDLQKEIFRIAAISFKVEASNLSINDNSNSINGWDSMAHLHLVTKLEERFNTRFSAAEIMIMNNFKSIESILKKHTLNVV